MSSINISINEPELASFKTVFFDWVAAFPENTMTSSQFNLLAAASGNLNENAHTRVLSALLRIFPVRHFFFNYLARKYPSRGLERILDADSPTAISSVRCFENYIDSCVRIGDICIIIENKVKGACDQPEQIDR